MGKNTRTRRVFAAVEAMEPRRLLSSAPIVPAQLDSPRMLALLPPPASAANPVTVDLMAVYTPAARAQAGSTALMLQRIQNDVADINQAFANSQVYVTVRLVHSEQVAYTENDNLGTDLDRLKDTSDGHLDSVHATRNTMGADLVTLYTAPNDPSAGGIAFLMDDPESIWGDEWGFSVVVVPPDGPRYGLAHELGHNFGAGHDHLTSANGGAFEDSFGHRFTASATVYRTIMSYDPGTTVPYYSNPDVSYLGVPTGIPAGQPQAADNARTINQTAPVVAAFRTLDNVAPTASVSAPNPLDAPGPVYEFDVTYADNIGLAISSIGAGNLLVTGPNGFSQAATYLGVDVETSGTPRTASYRITPPGGSWNPADNGRYSIQMIASQVRDGSGNYVATGEIGSFTAAFPTLPNLKAHQPDGWPAAIVASTVQDTTTDTLIHPGETVYVDFALKNPNPGTTVGGTFDVRLKLDGVTKVNVTFPGDMVDDGSYGFLPDVDVGSLTVGVHVLRLEIDYGGDVAESDEADNVFTRNITVTPWISPEVGVLVAQAEVTSGQATAVSFGTVQRLSASPEVTFTVRNTGTGALATSGLSLPAGFALVEPLASSIAAGGQDTFTVRMDTATVGTFAGQVSFVTDDVDENPFAFPVTGTVEQEPVVEDRPNLAGYTPGGWSGSIVLSVVPQTHADAGTIYDDQDVLADLAWKNLLPAFPTAASFVTSFYLDGTLLTTFTTTPADLAGDAGRQVLDYSLGTLASGQHTLRVEIDSGGAIGETSEADNIVSRTFSVSARPKPVAVVYAGSGTSGALIEDGRATALDLGTALQGATAAPVVFTVKNTGAITMNLSGLALPAGFTVVDALAASLVPGQTDTFSVRIDTATLGTRSGEISFVTNDPLRNPYNFPVTMSVVPSKPNLAPTVRSGWPAALIVSAGLSTRTQDSTLYSDQVLYVDLALSNLVPQVPLAQAVSVGLYVDDTLIRTVTFTSTQVNAGAAWSDDLQIGPLSVGAHTVRMEIDQAGAVSESAEADNSASRSITVTARPAPDISVFIVNDQTADPIVSGQAAPVDFGGILAGQTATRTLRVRNDGNAALTLAGVELPAGYSTPGALPATPLDPGLEWTFSVVLDAAAGGTYAGAVRILSDDPDESPFDAPLTGTVAVPDAAPPASTLRVKGVTRRTAKALAFNIVYTDATGVRRSSLGAGDVIVTGPRRFKQVPKWVKASSATDAPAIVGYYSIKPPGGSWDALDNGVYTVKLRPAQVSDTLGHATPTRTLGKFTVKIAKGKSRAVAAPHAPVFSQVRIDGAVQASAVGDLLRSR